MVLASANTLSAPTMPDLLNCPEKKSEWAHRPEAFWLERKFGPFRSALVSLTFACTKSQRRGEVLQMEQTSRPRSKVRTTLPGDCQPKGWGCRSLEAITCMFSSNPPHSGPAPFREPPAGAAVDAMSLEGSRR